MENLSIYDNVFIEINNIIKRNKNIEKLSCLKISKSVQFLDALNYLAENEIYNNNEIDNWKASRNRFVIEEGDYEQCICSQNIKYVHHIIHKKYEPMLTVQVGSCCVKKLSKGLYEDLVKDKCIYCDSNIVDKRKLICRQGYCKKDCKDFDNISKQIVKSQNKTHKEVSTSKSYCEWYLRTCINAPEMYRSYYKHRLEILKKKL